MAKSVSPAHQAQIDYIIAELRKGKKRGEVLATFRKKWQKIAIRTFDTRLKAATIALADQQKRVAGLAEQKVEQEAESLKSQIMSSLERQVILSQIARGEIPLKKPMVVSVGGGGGSEIEEVEVVPDWMDRKNAIAELNKMDGSYAPAKTELSASEGTRIEIVRE